MAATLQENREHYSFDTVAITEISVNSSTQQILFVGVSDAPQKVVISNGSNRDLWIKPNDNTTNQRGIFLPRGESLSYYVQQATTVYGIMDSGGTKTINVTRFS